MPATEDPGRFRGAQYSWAARDKEGQVLFVVCSSGPLDVLTRPDTLGLAGAQGWDEQLMLCGGFLRDARGLWGAETPPSGT